jgi:hypothetical protein
MKINSRLQAMLDGIVSELSAHDINEFDVVRRGKHGSVSFNVDRRKRTVFFSLTPSDRRASKNQRSDVRRTIREARNMTP